MKTFGRILFILLAICLGGLGYLFFTQTQTLQSLEYNTENVVESDSLLGYEIAQQDLESISVQSEDIEVKFKNGAIANLKNGFGIENLSRERFIPVSSDLYNFNLNACGDLVKIELARRDYLVRYIECE